MKKLTAALGLCLALAFSILMTSCNGGADHSNPQSVAEAALACYDTRDYAGLKELVSPANEDLLKEMDRMIEYAAKSDSEPEKIERTFKEIKDGLSGYPLSENSVSAKVKFESPKYPGSVVLEKVDGKWYFEKFGY